MARCYDDDQSWRGEDSDFDTTEWTQILGAALSRSVMGELYRKYRKPIYHFP